jgi:hypothetical protein
MLVLFLKLLVPISLFLVVILNPGPAVLRLEINLAEFVAKADANAAELRELFKLLSLLLSHNPAKRPLTGPSLILAGHQRRADHLPP